MSKYRPTPFEIRHEAEGERMRLRLRGELDVATAPQLEGALEQLRAKRTPVLIDLDEVEFIDSTGLRVILAAVTEAREDAWWMRVTDGSPAVRRLFELSGTADLIRGGQPRTS